MRLLMNNQVWGMMTLLVCLAGYLMAVRKYRHGDIRMAILLLMVCGFLLRLYASTDLFLHEWDERYHALVAKNLMAHPLLPTLYDQPLLPYDFKDWMGNHIWLHKQPLPLWSMALSMSLFGVNEIALRLPSLLMTTLGIWITYSTGKHLFNIRTGFIAAFLYSIHGLIIELTAGRVATDHFDISFLFFIQLALLFAIRFAENKHIVYNLLCGISVGMAILSKWLPALIVLPIWLLLVLDSRKFTLKQILVQLTLLCITMTAVSLPWQIFIHQTYPLEATWESGYNLRHFTEVIEGHGGSILYHFNKLRIIFGELVYLPLIWFLWHAIRRPGNYRRMALLLWFMIPYLFFSLAKTKMQGYTLFAAPAIFIITGLFWQTLYLRRKGFRMRWMIHAVLFLLLALPVRYSIERIKPFSTTVRNPGWAEDLKAFGKSHQNEGNMVIFNVDHPIEAMFYMDCTAYPFLPDPETLQGLTRNGYKVFINGVEDPDYALSESDQVEFIHLRTPDPVRSDDVNRSLD